MQTFPSLCQACIHLRPQNEYEGEKTPTCRAYKEGIPYAYWTGIAAHTDDGRGTTEVYFRQAPGAEHLVVSYLSFWGTVVDGELEVEAVPGRLLLDQQALGSGPDS